MKNYLYLFSYLSPNFIHCHGLIVKYPHQSMSLNPWPLAVEAVLEGYGTCRRWSPARGSEGCALRFYIPAPLPVLPLLPVRKCERSQLHSAATGEPHGLLVSPCMTDHFPSSHKTNKPFHPWAAPEQIFGHSNKKRNGHSQSHRVFMERTRRA